MNDLFKTIRNSNYNIKDHPVTEKEAKRFYSSFIRHFNSLTKKSLDLTMLIRKRENSVTINNNPEKGGHFFRWKLIAGFSIIYQVKLIEKDSKTSYKNIGVYYEYFDRCNVRWISVKETNMHKNLFDNYINKEHIS